MDTRSLDSSSYSLEASGPSFMDPDPQGEATAMEPLCANFVCAGVRKT